MRKDERGSILVEFVGSFLLFALLVISILSLVNIVTAQARIHYALTQTANTLSSYGYALHAIGLDKALVKLAGNAHEVQESVNEEIENVNMILDGINGLNFSDIETGAAAVIDGFGDFNDNLQENPKGVLQQLMQYAASEGASVLLGEALKPLMLHYLANGDGVSGQDYLRSAGIGELKFAEFRIPRYNAAGEEESVGSLTGLEGGNSMLLDKDGNVKLTVQYEIDYVFGGLKLPWSGGKLKVAQSAMTKMWLGGAGDGYKE